MTKTVSIKINAEVPDGTDPRFLAFKLLSQCALISNRLDSWQGIPDVVGLHTIGECHFEITEDEDEDAACEQCGNTLNDGSDICDQCGGRFV